MTNVFDKQAMKERLKNIELHKHTTIDTAKKLETAQSNISRTAVKNEIINIPINVEDDAFVKFIKEEINNARITLQNIYDCSIFKNATDAYNLYDSLRKRPTITAAKLEKWAAVLKKNLVIGLE